MKKLSYELEETMYSLKGINALLHSMATGTIEEHSNFSDAVVIINDKLAQCIKTIEKVVNEEEK